MDYNITRRCQFVAKQHKYQIQIRKGVENTIDFGIADNEIFVLKKIDMTFAAGWQNWSPFPPAGHQEMGKIILNNFEATFEGARAENSPEMMRWLSGLFTKCYGVAAANIRKDLSPHRAISNYNNRLKLLAGEDFQLFIILYGMLFTSTSELSVSPNECIGFAMLSSEQQGNIIIDEANANPMYDYLAQLGGPDFRKLPFSMQALKDLPDAIQYAVVNKVFGPSFSHPALPEDNIKALPDPEAVVSQFIADGFEQDFPLEQLKVLAHHMVNKGWKKTNQ